MTTSDKKVKKENNKRSKNNLKKIWTCEKKVANL